MRNSPAGVVILGSGWRHGVGGPRIGAMGLGLVWFLVLVWFARVFTGIRELLACFRRRPCAGRHLLFFAAAKKSRQ
ncbi:hypothetical protein BCAR13_1320065 [Paraburkholderia caribensis]|nr:hypothetical protein BCAR13_1320065 [Paraburkholderia caribensis]